MDIKYRLASAAVAVLAVIQPCGAADLMAAGMDHEWTDRVIPMPKEILVNDSIKASAGAIEFKALPLTSAPFKGTIEQLLRSFARGDGKQSQVTIRMALTDPADPALPGAIKDRLAQLPNKEHAYAIQTTKGAADSVDILLAANTSQGLLYAARTLHMLVKPAGEYDQRFTHIIRETVAPRLIPPEVRIEIPIVTVTDWPDIDERGFWTHAWDLTKYGHISLQENATRFMTQWKLNLREYAGTFLHIDDNGKPGLGGAQAWQRSIAVTRDDVRQGAELGLKVVPVVIGHFEQQSRHLMSFTSNETTKAFLKTLLAVENPDPAKRRARSFGPGFCCSNPKLIDLLAGWITAGVSFIKGYHNDLTIWTSEYITPCFCKDCAGKDPFAVETAAYAKAFARVKAEYPDLRMRVCTPTAPGPNGWNGMIDVAMEQPVEADFGLTYYCGYGYSAKKVPLIIPKLEAFAKSGRRLSVFPTLNGGQCFIAPCTWPQFVQYRCQEFADKQLASVSAYLVPYNARPYYYQVSLAALGEFAWNARGRTPEEFARAYATITGFADPALFAEWVKLAGEAGWAGCDLPDPRDHAVGFYGNQRFIDRYKSREDGWVNLRYVGPSHIFTDEAQYQRILENARKAVTLAQSMNNQELICESEYTLGVVDAWGALNRICQITRAPLKFPWEMPDEAALKELVEQIDRFDRCGHLVRVGLIDWAKLIETRENPGCAVQPPHSSRYWSITYSFLCTADVIQTVTAEFKIKDPNSECRVIELGEWSRKDFSNSTALVKIDITGKVPPSGGSFNIVFEKLEGVDCQVKKINLVSERTVITPFKPKDLESIERKVLDTFPWQHMFLYMQEGFIHVPEVMPGEKLILETEFMVSVKDFEECAGLIGMRRVWERGTSPWDKAK